MFCKREDAKKNGWGEGGLVEETGMQGTRHGRFGSPCPPYIPLKIYGLYDQPEKRISIFSQSRQGVTLILKKTKQTYLSQM